VTVPEDPEAKSPSPVKMPPFDGEEETLRVTLFAKFATKLALAVTLKLKSGVVLTIFEPTVQFTNSYPFLGFDLTLSLVPLGTVVLPLTEPPEGGNALTVIVYTGPGTGILKTVPKVVVGYTSYVVPTSEPCERTNPENGLAPFFPPLKLYMD